MCQAIIVLNAGSSSLYHAWNATKDARRMCIDRIDWTDQGPKVAGPTTEPQTIEVPD